MTAMAWAWVGLGVAAVALMAVFVWFLITTIIPLLFNLLLGVAVVLALLGFFLLAMQDARGSSRRGTRRASRRR